METKTKACGDKKKLLLDFVPHPYTDIYIYTCGLWTSGHLDTGFMHSALARVMWDYQNASLNRNSQACETKPRAVENPYKSLSRLFQQPSLEAAWGCNPTG